MCGAGEGSGGRALCSSSSSSSSSSSGGLAAAQYSGAACMSCVDLPWQQEGSRLAGDGEGASMGSSDQ
jgi:hypothetical protein